jgi:hypothetical protein
MIETLVLSLLYGIFRAAHGAGAIPRAYSIILMAFFTMLYLNLNIIFSTLLVVGLFIGLVPGWGKYQSATGSKYPREEKEIFFIDFITDKIENGTLAGIVGMSLRWTVFFIPLFGVFLKPWLVFALLLEGPIYAAHRLHNNWTVTEFISGALLGGLIALL